MDIYEIAINIGEGKDMYTYWIEVKDLYIFEDIIYDYQKILGIPVTDKIIDDKTRCFYVDKKCIARIVYRENEKRKNHHNQNHRRTI